MKNRESIRTSASDWVTTAMPFVPFSPETYGAIRGTASGLGEFRLVGVGVGDDHGINAVVGHQLAQASDVFRIFLYHNLLLRELT